MNASVEKKKDGPVFDRSPPGPAGEIQQVSPLIRRILAPNPGPFTFTGTCGYVVGRSHVAVIDPGPDDPAHVARLLEALAGEEIAFILATHTHRDHSPAAAALRAATGARVVGCAPVKLVPGAPAPRSHDLDYAPDQILADGEALEGAGFVLRAVATPGHASNHLAFALEEERALFSGDHVMAWSTTVVAPPDGSMADYMRSLERLQARDDVIYWPGHGGPVREPRRFVRALANHRRHRELLILAGLRAGDRTVEALADRLYVGLDPRLRGGAARSVLAHLEDLVARGLARCEGAPALDATFASVEKPPGAAP
jgi:glyoxylase-like metal-dependent hydrolase (beta-lactamase superfamily II)